MSLRLNTPDDTRGLGERIGRAARPGDVIVLVGELGAGKTTLAQGIGAGLGVRGPVLSPTFIIARAHPPLADGPALIHVDAYRLSSLAELDDLDLDASVDDAVTVVEWGRGLAEVLAESVLTVELDRERGALAAGDSGDGDGDGIGNGDGIGDGGEGVRVARVSTAGPRWTTDALAPILAAPHEAAPHEAAP